MEEDTTERKVERILCWQLPSKKQWIWLYTVVPSALSCVLFATSLLLDSVLAGLLVWTNKSVTTGVATFVFVYLPAVFTLVLQPLQPPHSLTSQTTVTWVFRTLFFTIVSPVLISVSLAKRLLWTVRVVRADKPYEEILTEYETVMPKEVHSYVFLQAFVHCAPQAILQTHLLIIGGTSHKYTEVLQYASVLISLLTVASCTASFHRYEAQVAGGRPPVLLLSPPELPPLANPATPLLPLTFCLRSKVIALDLDCPAGQVLAFTSWLFIMFGRILCLVISFEIYPRATLTSLVIHLSFILLYFFSSQSTTLLDIPSRLVNAMISLIVLVEVSVRFHKVPILYVIFFMSLFAEDTYLMILFFVYDSYTCSTGILNCSNFGLYAYLILNSHVIGIILFGIYLVKLRPPRKSLISSLSTTLIVSS